MSRGQEVKEALRAQMEVQSKLHLLVEVIFLFCGIRRACIHTYAHTGRKRKDQLTIVMSLRIDTGTVQYFMISSILIDLIVKSEVIIMLILYTKYWKN